MFTKIYYKTKEILRFIINIFKYITTYFIVVLFLFLLQKKFKFNDDIGFSLVLVLSTSLFIVLLKIENKSIKEYLKIHKISFKTILILISFTLISMLFDAIIIEILDNFIVPNTQDDTILYFWSILHLAILAPICEEIIFRGILFQKLKEIMPLFLSIIIQGFIFGIVHGSFIQSLLAGFSGILYALVYNYKKNLTLPILIHAFNNIFLIILNLLFPNL